MAVDFNGTKLLFWAKNLGVSFRRTLTLGHQGFFCSSPRFRNAVKDFGLSNSEKEINHCFEHVPFGALYADGLFRYLGAEELVSVDRSDFEQATLLHDLNETFPDQHKQKYDFVFDGGTLEHIFDYPTALRHCLELVAPGGHFLTITPAHGLMGHGFYQLSPETLFRVFSVENGFSLRKIVLDSAIKDDAEFFQVNDPAVTGCRTELVAPQPMYLASLAKRTAIVPIFARHPQQSDYSAIWARHQKTPLGTPVLPTGVLGRIRVALNPYWPHWLRSLKDRFLLSRGKGPPRLKNRRHFRRLTRAEVCSERV